MNKYGIIVVIMCIELQYDAFLIIYVILFLLCSLRSQTKLLVEVSFRSLQ